MNPLAIRVIRECLEIIEARLRQPIDVAGLAVASGYSLWHFQRLFQALVGETVGSYVRRRRLSESTHALRRSGARIFDIAAEFQFQSHEAYGSFHRIRSDKYDGRTVGELWRAFFEQRHRVRNAVDDDLALGVVSPRRAPDPHDDSEATYVAGASVSSLAGNPDTFEHVQLAPRTYALFDHHGEMAGLRRTMDSIYAVWLVDNDRYTTDDSPVVEIYTNRFRHDAPDSFFSIAVPLVAR